MASEVLFKILIIKALVDQSRYAEEKKGHLPAAAEYPNCRKSKDQAVDPNI
jgi:hypothetical protein